MDGCTGGLLIVVSLPGMRREKWNDSPENRGGGRGGERGRSHSLLTFFVVLTIEGGGGITESERNLPVKRVCFLRVCARAGCFFADIRVFSLLDKTPTSFYILVLPTLDF